MFGLKNYRKKHNHTHITRITPALLSVTLTSSAQTHASLTQTRRPKLMLTHLTFFYRPDPPGADTTQS